MIAALFASIGLQGGLKISRSLAAAFVIAALFAAGGLGAWRAAAAVERMIAAGAAAARDAERTAWQAQIAASNAETERARAEAAVAAAKASAAAEQTITGLRAALSDLEKRNETMPGGARVCLDAGDLGDLNRLRQRP